VYLDFETLMGEREEERELKFFTPWFGGAYIGVMHNRLDTP